MDSRCKDQPPAAVSGINTSMFPPVISEKGNPDLKQTFDCLNTFLVRQEQNHMIISLDHCIVVRDNDIITTYDCTNRCTSRQFDFINGSSHNL